MDKKEFIEISNEYIRGKYTDDYIKSIESIEGFTNKWEIDDLTTTIKSLRDINSQIPFNSQLTLVSDSLDVVDRDEWIAVADAILDNASSSIHTFNNVCECHRHLRNPLKAKFRGYVEGYIDKMGLGSSLRNLSYVNKNKKADNLAKVIYNIKISMVNKKGSEMKDYINTMCIATCYAVSVLVTFKGESYRVVEAPSSELVSSNEWQ